MPAPPRRRPRPARRHARADDAGRWRLERRGRDPLRNRMTSERKRSLNKRSLKVQVRAGKSRTLSSKLWLDRQLNDPYVARAKREGFRSRAAYKLAEIDDKHRLLKPGSRVVDLGAAPGGW